MSVTVVATFAEPSREPTVRRAILIAAIAVAVCAAGAIAYLTVWRPGASDAVATPLPSVTGSPTPSASPSPSAATPTRSAAPSAPAATPSPTPTPTPTPTATSEPTPSATPTPTPTPTPTAPSRTSADVELSYLAFNAGSGAVEASGYATVYEDGGTCTLVLTKDGATARGVIDGLPDVATTSCGGLEVPGSQLSSGTWRAVLEYESPTTVGRSEAREVVVP
jgi:predicted component of type VI protein secretion system